MTSLTAPLTASSSLIASTQALKGVELVNQNLRLFSEKIRKQTARVRAQFLSLTAGVKRSPYYLLHLLKGARQTALKWLTDRLESLLGRSLEALLNKARTAFRLSRKLANLTNDFPTSSSANP